MLESHLCSDGRLTKDQNLRDWVTSPHKDNGLQENLSSQNWDDCSTKTESVDTGRLFN